MQEAQSFRYYLRVRYGECDQQGVVFNARYGEYVDLACTEFLNTVLGRSTTGGGGFEMQVVKLLIEWTAPARYDDALEISVALKSLGTTSFALGFEMRKVGTRDETNRFGTRETIVTAETVNVHMDPKSWTKSALPDAMRAKLTAGGRGQFVDHAGVFTSKG
jgi:acyl-CoA thioester hydrolase